MNLLPVKVCVINFRGAQVVGWWLKHSYKAECVNVKGQTFWLPKSLTTLTSIFTNNEDPDKIRAWAHRHDVPADEIYWLTIPVWLAKRCGFPDLAGKVEIYSIP